MKWDKERLKKVGFGVKKANYECIPKNSDEIAVAKRYPEIFKFEALSIGDAEGQAFIVPLDESCKETAEYIMRAIKAYKGD